MSEIEERVCRICFEQLGKGDGIKPCKCSGSQAYVHIECVKEWITTRGFHKCNVCKAEYTGLNLKKSPKSFCDWVKEEPENGASIGSAVLGFGFLFYVHLIGFLQFFTSVELVDHLWRYILLALVGLYTTLTVAGLVIYVLKTLVSFRKWKSTHFRITWPNEAHNV